jgi:hypothetical protein
VFLMIASTSSCGISSTTSAIAIAIAAFEMGQECAHRASTSRRGMDQLEGGGANEGKKTTQASSAGVNKSFAGRLGARLQYGGGPNAGIKLRASNCGHQIAGIKFTS